MADRDTKRRRVESNDDAETESNIDDVLQTAGTSVSTSSPAANSSSTGGSSSGATNNNEDNSVGVVVPDSASPANNGLHDTNLSSTVKGDSSSTTNTTTSNNSSSSNNAFVGTDADLLKLARENGSGNNRISSDTGANRDLLASTDSLDASPEMRDDHWHQVRKDNHKEVERRRRQTINNGIEQLAKIVPDCDKHKGKILEKAVKYIEKLLEEAKKQHEESSYSEMVLKHRISELAATNKTLNAELTQSWSEVDHWKKRCQQLEESS